MKGIFKDFYGKKTHTSQVMCVLNKLAGVPGPACNANTGNGELRDDGVKENLQPYIGVCMECGKKYMLYYPTWKPVSHVVETIPILCNDCHEKFFWQEVKK